MPCKNLPKDAFAARVDHVTVTRDDAVKVPLVDAPDAVVEAGTILGAEQVPDEAALPPSLAGGAHGSGKEARGQAGGGGDAGARVLLGGGHVEEQVGLDEGAVGAVEEDELAVGVAVDVLVVEVAVKVVADAQVALGRAREDGREGHGLVLLLPRRPLLREPLGPDQLRLRIRLVPRSQEDVMLHVRRRDVPNVVPQRLERRSYLGRQRHGREDGEGAGCESD